MFIYVVNQIILQIVPNNGISQQALAMNFLPEHAKIISYAAVLRSAIARIQRSLPTQQWHAPWPH
jgi:hypothetical protein